MATLAQDLTFEQKLDQLGRVAIEVGLGLQAETDFDGHPAKLVEFLFKGKFLGESCHGGLTPSLHQMILSGRAPWARCPTGGTMLEWWFVWGYFGLRSEILRRSTGAHHDVVSKRIPANRGRPGRGFFVAFAPVAGGRDGACSARGVWLRGRGTPGRAIAPPVRYQSRLLCGDGRGRAAEAFSPEGRASRTGRGHGRVV